MILTRHFSLSELACRDGQCVPDALIPNARKLCLELETLRAALGRPILIVSGYRSPAWNARVRGAQSSQHMTGKAADIRVYGVPPGKVADAIERLIAAGKMRQGGLGLYPSWVHYDVRGTRARWQGR